MHTRSYIVLTYQLRSSSNVCLYIMPFFFFLTIREFSYAILECILDKLHFDIINPKSYTTTEINYTRQSRMMNSIEKNMKGYDI